MHADICTTQVQACIYLRVHKHNYSPATHKALSITVWYVAVDCACRSVAVVLVVTTGCVVQANGKKGKLSVLKQVGGQS